MTPSQKSVSQASYNVVVPRQAKPGDKSRNKAFRFNKFIYDTDSDTYTCPLGKTLSSTSAATTVKRKYTNKQACTDCPSKDLCLTEKQEHKVIRRTKADDIYDRTERICKQSKELYRERQQIVEPVFGSIKQTQNGRYFLLRTKEKVRCEAGLLFLGYNIKRSVSSLGFDCLMALLDRYGAKTVNRSSNTTFLLLIYPCIHVISRNNKPSKTFMRKVHVRGGCKASAAQILHSLPSPCHLGVCRQAQSPIRSNERGLLHKNEYEASLQMASCLDETDA